VSRKKIQSSKLLRHVATPIRVDVSNFCCVSNFAYFA
jgi:hypothetical protein